jgi:hypothetical protein
MKIIASMLLLVFSLADASNRIHFNKHGDIVKPDFEQVRLGLIDSKKGQHEAAMIRYMKAAKFGNYYAITLIAAQYIEQQEHVKALAWLHLIDLNKTQQRDVVIQTLKLLETKLNTQDLQAAANLNQKLVATYGHEAAFKYREKWKKSLLFTGSHIRGKVPKNLTFSYEIGAGGANQSAFSIPGHRVESQLQQFVFEYEFDIPVGEVILAPIDLQD